MFTTDIDNEEDLDKSALDQLLTVLLAELDMKQQVLGRALYSLKIVNGSVCGSAKFNWFYISFAKLDRKVIFI